jgi:hypothetical protein
MDEILNQIRDAVPNALGALAILVVGYVAARVLANLARRALQRTDVDNKIARWVSGKDDAAAVPVETWVSRGVFYLVLLFVMVAFFQALGLTLITEPLSYSTRCSTMRPVCWALGCCCWSPGSSRACSRWSFRAP